ncbi:MAG: DNA polymerase III subunit epsilon [Pelagibacterales bacterium]|nr:DNA polymerase III subunit epsilon [Pelagibacterales bacterium]PPR16648.1 MAG: DNA polymerase III subunit epsilon [Alphaproteobacteria bacterium MarineAlpha9_Bin3]|tara:strand:- start:19886 stop:20569 length:684 start_codon:yes stop_codon:yes gene_type:complete
MRRIALDTETTGLNPLDGHRIVEIGCIELEENIPTGKEWHAYINPERPMPEAAYAVHGLSEEFLLNKPIFKDIAGDFINFINGAELVIHNAKFDIGFLNNELKKTGLSTIDLKKTIDTVQLAREKIPGAAASLDALCKRFDIDLSIREKHGALLDAKLLAEVYLELTGGRQASLTLTQKNKEKNNEKNKEEKESIEGLKFTSIKLTEKDLEDHREMLKKINSPLWLK